MVRLVQPGKGAIRAANRASVVNVLGRTPAATRAEVMARIGRSRAMACSLLGDLRRGRLFFERPGSSTDGLGRLLNRLAGLAIAVDVGGMLVLTETAPVADRSVAGTGSRLLARSTAGGS